MTGEPIPREAATGNAWLEPNKSIWRLALLQGEVYLPYLGLCASMLLKEILIGSRASGSVTDNHSRSVNEVIT